MPTVNNNKVQETHFLSDELFGQLLRTVYNYIQLRCQRFVSLTNNKYYNKHLSFIKRKISQVHFTRCIKLKELFSAIPYVIKIRRDYSTAQCTLVIPRWLARSLNQFRSQFKAHPPSLSPISLHFLPLTRRLSDKYLRINTRKKVIKKTGEEKMFSICSSITVHQFIVIHFANLRNRGPSHSVSKKRN